MHVIHEIEPVWNTESRILFLGTMPSPASRLAGFYYMHPRNRFWPVMKKIFSVTLPSVNERRTFLLQNNIALWDVLCRCDIDGAQDSSIKNAVPNNFTQILNESKISRIFCTGKTALSLYEKLCAKNYSVPYEGLPSTSPANASWTLEKLCEEYRKKIFADAFHQ